MFGEARTALAEHPGWRWYWRLSAVVAVVRLLLLGAFMVDARLDVGALPGDAFYRSHSCLAAYWRASALAREGVVNLYDAALYEKHTIMRRRSSRPMIGAATKTGSARRRRG